MAKLTKKQKKQLQAARADSKLTKREVNQLRALGIPDEVINNTKQGQVSFSKKAQATLPPAPTPPAPKPEQKKQIQAARADNLVTKREANQLLDLGVPAKVIDNTKQDSVYVTNKAREVLAPPPTPDPEPSQPSPPAGLSRDTQVTFDGQPWGYRDPGNVNTESWTGRGQAPENENATPFLAPLYKYSQGAIEDAARRAGISNINSVDEVNRVLAQLGAGPAPATGNNGQGGAAPRDTGKFEDIQAAQAEDQAAGQAAADEFASKDGSEAEGGLDPAVQELIDGLQLQVGDLTTNLADREKYWTGQFNTLQTNSTNALTTMQGLMLAQKTASESTQTLLQNQLASTQAALTNQQRLTKNLSSAYVPAAEQTALSVAYGDARTDKRKQTNNSLSDLSIVSGVGQNNSLVGLQL